MERTGEEEEEEEEAGGGYIMKMSLGSVEGRGGDKWVEANLARMLRFTS